MDIVAKYTHSRLGTFMFNLGAKWTKFILKHQVFYYVISILWNHFMLLIGLFCTLGLWVASWFNKKITFHKYYWIYYIKVGPEYWGGFDTALCFLRDQSSDDGYINTHEWGHSLSQGWLGPLFFFIVAIPSAIRWWDRELHPNKEFKDYDAVWFEDLATQAGLYAIRYLEEHK